MPLTRLKTRTSKNNILQLLAIICVFCSFVFETIAAETRPNILSCISDDQSYSQIGANGDPLIKTPAFDRIAREGLLFIPAYRDASTCAPSAILRSQHIWRLEEAGNIHSTLPAKFPTCTELLAKAGYTVTYTGKEWGPGRLDPGARKSNPAGQAFNNGIKGRCSRALAAQTTQGISKNFWKASRI